MDQMLDKKLYDLGDCSMKVPPELSGILLAKIEEEQKDQPLEKSLGELKQHTSSPAADAFNNIVQHLPEKPAIIKLFRFRSVAAIIAGILLGTWGITKFIQKPSGLKLPETAETASRPDPVPAKKTPVKRLVNNNPALAADRKQPDGKLIINAPVKDNNGNDLTDKNLFNNNGLDNPAFSAFANYMQTTGEKDENKANVPVVLTLDNYTTLSIPAKMTDFMRSLQKVNKRGKATAKAKRASRRLHKIRKKDDAYFKNKERNPADIIDLGNFIFGNR